MGVIIKRKKLTDLQKMYYKVLLESGTDWKTGADLGFSGGEYISFLLISKTDNERIKLFGRKYYKIAKNENDAYIEFDYDVRKTSLDIQIELDQEEKTLGREFTMGEYRHFYKNREYKFRIIIDRIPIKL